MAPSPGRFLCHMRVLPTSIGVSGRKSKGTNVVMITTHTEHGTAGGESLICARYKIVRQIGGGGTANVYEAHDTRIGRKVALKVSSLSSNADRSELIRLDRETRAIGSLSHPNIVAIYDVVREGEQHVIVMEWVDGVTLADLIALGPLPISRVLKILAPLSSAIDAVHSNGIIHGDIKPSNIMLTADGTVKLMDFGISRQFDETMFARTDAIIGTAAFMAPEQLRGAPSTPQSDIWALGGVLYYMLTGSRPFDAPTLPGLTHKIVFTEPEIPGHFDDIRPMLERALAKSPRERFATAGELAYAFERVACLSVDASYPEAPTGGVLAPWYARPAPGTDAWSRTRRRLRPVARLAIILAASLLVGAVIIGALLTGRQIGRPPRITVADAIHAADGRQATPTVVAQRRRSQSPAASTPVHVASHPAYRILQTASRQRTQSVHHARYRKVAVSRPSLRSAPAFHQIYQTVSRPTSQYRRPPQIPDARSHDYAGDNGLPSGWHQANDSGNF